MKRLEVQKLNKKETTYTAVSNAIIEDRRLTSDEKMLLIYLYRRQNVFKEWNDLHLREYLGRYDQESGAVSLMGEKKFGRIKAKLRRFGYLSIKQETRSKNGEFTSNCDYKVQHSPPQKPYGRKRTP